MFLRNEVMQMLAVLTTALTLLCSTTAEDVLTTAKLKVNGKEDVNVFVLNGAKFFPPSIKFEPTCPLVSYDHLYGKYAIALPISVNFKSEGPLLQGKAAKIKLWDVTLNADFLPAQSGVSFVIQLLQTDKANVIALVDNFERYSLLYASFVGRPGSLTQSLKFIIDGTVDSVRVRFDPIRSSNLPAIRCPSNQWIVFQRRVDRTVSFRQNWDTYAKGFGDPSGNFWMGLEQLFLRTVTNEKNMESDSSELSRCRMRVEVEIYGGGKISAEWGMFQVFEPRQQFRIRIDQMSENQFDKSAVNFTARLNGLTFSTYDFGVSSHCSRLYGFSGWWFNNCYDAFLLNAAYPDHDKSPSTDGYMNAHYNGKWVLLKSSTMMLKCST